MDMYFGPTLIPYNMSTVSKEICLQLICVIYLNTYLSQRLVLMACDNKESME